LIRGADGVGRRCPGSQLLDLWAAAEWRAKAQEGAMPNSDRPSSRLWL